MKKPLAAIAVMFLGGVLSSSAHAQTADPGINIVSNATGSFNVDGRFQLFGVGENVPDSVRNNNRVYLFLKEARLGVKGNYKGYKYETNVVLGGEEQTSANSPTLSLLDAFVDAPLPAKGASVMAGQFRVPYSREALTDTGYMNYTARSIASDAFNWGGPSNEGGRDVGMSLNDYRSDFAGTFGVFAGGGRDVNVTPTHALPEALGIPMLVTRVGYDDGADKDIYHVTQDSLGVTKTEKAAFVNALFMKDTTIGHSTVMNIDPTGTKPLLIDPNWNPYIGEEVGKTPAGFADGDLFMVGGDLLERKPVGDNQVLTGEAEFDWGGYQNGYGGVHMTAWRAQGSYRYRKVEGALRYAALLPGRTMGVGAYSGTTGVLTSVDPLNGPVIDEITPSLTWYIHGHNVKLVGDVPLYLNMPVLHEPGVGSYVLADLPDQVSASKTITRDFVPEIRGMFQFLF